MAPGMHVLIVVAENMSLREPAKLTDQSIGKGEAVRAAAIQLNATDDTDRNLETADRLVRAAASQGAELVVLPEKWTVLGTREDMAAGAQTLDGRAMAWARETALALGIDLVAGSFFEDVPG